MVVTTRITRCLSSILLGPVLCFVKVTSSFASDSEEFLMLYCYGGASMGRLTLFLSPSHPPPCTLLIFPAHVCQDLPLHLGVLVWTLETSRQEMGKAMHLKGMTLS